MTKELLALVCAVAFAWFIHPQNAVSQLFTTSPAVVQQSSKDIKIIFHADRSGKSELINATSLYAHIGVTLTSAPSAWVHVKGDWASNTADKKFTKISGTNDWQLPIGDLKTYFGLKDGEEVAKIAVIARLATGAGNGYGQTDDFFIDVQPEGLQLKLSADESLPYAIHGNKTINFSADCTTAAKITISVNGRNIGTANSATSLKASYDFTPSSTTYNIEATAVAGSQTVSTSMTVDCLPQSASKAFQGGTVKQGATANANGTVTFCLAAPRKSNVVLVPSWDNYELRSANVMNYTDVAGQRYFWVTTSSALEKGKYLPYYFIVDGSISVADPYAHLVLDPNADSRIHASLMSHLPSYPSDKVKGNPVLAVYRSDMDSYDWSDATLSFRNPDTRSMTIYEMLLRDFSGDGSDQNGKMYGTFSSALEHLDYVASLGVDAVELMPVMEFNDNSSWGYNTNFYMAPDKVYGTPDDMKRFVDECHKRGMAVILDIVFNQSDWLAPWYQMYGGVADNPFYNATAPHDYSVLNDWNQDNPIVRRHWKDVLTYWLEAYKVDGFRFDLVKGLGSNSSYDSGTDAYNSSRVALMKELNSSMRAVRPDVIHINELLGSAKEENENAANGQLGWHKLSQPCYDYATGKGNSSGSMNGFVASNNGLTLGTTVDYAESHDEPRVASKLRTTNTSSCDASVAYTTSPKAASVRRLGAVAAQMLLTPGSKMIWQFGEIAADDEQGSDLEKLRAIAPKWNQMSSATRSALLDNYRQLIHLRSLNPELFRGDASVQLNGYSNTLTSARTIRIVSTDSRKEIVAFFNPAISGAARTVNAQVAYITPSTAQLVTASYGGSSTPFTPVLNAVGSNNVSVSLQPGEWAVFASADVSGIEGVLPDDSATNGISCTVVPSAGAITISGDFTSAEIYTPAGMMVDRIPSAGVASSVIVDVAPGIYIVRVDSKPFKVAVP